MSLGHIPNPVLDAEADELRLHRVSRISLALVLLLVMSNRGSGSVCRSTKYPTLVLDVNVVRNAEAFIAEISEKYQVTINNSFRSFQEQKQLYDRWLARGKMGNPAAKPGASRHEAGFAFDLNRLQGLTFIQWNRVLNAGQRYGFEYLLGDFPGEGTQKFDWPHFQANPIDYGLSLSQALSENRVRSETIQECVWKADLPNESKAYLSRLVITNLRFSAATWRGQKLTYLDASMTNSGDRSVSRVELRAELCDTLGELLQVRLLHPAGLYKEPLKPGATLALHLVYGRVDDSWADGPLRVRATYVEW